MFNTRFGVYLPQKSSGCRRHLSLQLLLGRLTQVCFCHTAALVWTCRGKGETVAKDPPAWRCHLLLVSWELGRPPGDSFLLLSLSSCQNKQLQTLLEQISAMCCLSSGWYWLPNFFFFPRIMQWSLVTVTELFLLSAEEYLVPVELSCLFLSVHMASVKFSAMLMKMDSVRTK